MWEQYQYVYVSLVTSIETHTKWRRILKTRVGEWIEKNQGALSYFSTIQQFDRAKKAESESHWSPLFFDLDSPGYKNDCPEEDRLQLLNTVLLDARKIVDYFVTGFEVQPKVWFSGGKGFHITVPGEAFDASPDAQLTYHWKHLATKVAKKLDVGTLDWRVYSIPRMWRIENTQHKSGRYKIPLELTELGNGIEHILSLAETPRRHDIGAEPASLELTSKAIEIKPETKALYKESADEYIERTKVQEGVLLESPVFNSKHPPCVQYLLDNGLALLGTKNQADMALANYCKASGMGLNDAEMFMSAWAKSIPLNLTHVEKASARVMQSMMVLKTVYSNSKYRFSCGSIRLCGMDVNCDQCNVEHSADVVETTLVNFSGAENYGRRICVEADIVGKDSSEMIVPKKIVGYCPFNPDSAQCGRCAMAGYYNDEAKRMERTITLDASEKLTVQLLDTTRANLHHRIKQIFGVEKRCTSFKYDVEWGNAHVLYLSTRISGDFQVEQQLTRSRAIYLGHAVSLNNSYKLYGYVWNHPTTNKAIFVINKAELLESSLANFSLTKKQLNELTIFQPKAEQTPLDKIHEIHAIFNTDLIRVFGREQLIMAVDLVFHSARRISFQKTPRLKGWLDVLIVGDTRQGKSDVAEKLMAYYDLGVMAAGETASRTGLLYTIHTVAGEEAWIAFGLLCRANGYLVVIDEIHGMSPQDFKEFTLVRSKGVVDVKRSAYGAAYAETRLISIANAKPGKSLGSYGYPVQAIPDIPTFMALEDVSRFDFCVGVKAGDVTDEMINRDVNEIAEVDNPYTAELCRNLILWIWTRTVDEVIIDAATEKRILAIAMQLSQDYIPDIPLIESADIRHKIARIATAVAGRVFSSTDGKTLIVKPEHADAAMKILESFYKAPGLDYYGWSDDRKRIIVTPERAAVLRYDFKTNFASDWEIIVRWVLDSNSFNKTFLRSACGLDAKDTDLLMAFLMTNRFIVTYGHQYTKTPQGREFLLSLLVDQKNDAFLLEKQTKPDESKDEKAGEF